MRKVFIDPKLEKYIVPKEMRNNSKSENKVFTPGTRIPLPDDARFIRLFTAWGSKKGNAGFDIDLSAAFIKELDGGKLKMERVSFYNQSEDYAVHSGDFTSCKEYNPGDKKITAEYIDIDIQKIKEAGFKYVITAEFIFGSGGLVPGYDIDIHSYSGVILLNNMRNSREQYIDINNSLFKVKLSGEYQSHTAIAIDVETNEIVILDQYSKERDGMTVDAMFNKMNSFKKLYFNAGDFTENISSLLKMYCSANDFKVTNDIEKAEIICSYDDYKDISANQTMFNISDNLENIINLLN